MQGKTVNGFTLQRKLGEGGMAEVWYAENEIGKAAAVKVLSKSLSNNEQIVERFHNEALVMVKLDHPNIRQVYGYGYIDDRHCIVMEYLEGDDLETLLKQGRRFTEEELRKWWNQIISALNYTHSKDIVHRDIKPSNIFLDHWGNVKLLDFGIAKLMENMSMTRTGTMMGTLMYMSPEQVRDTKHIDYRTDIYSLAVTFAQLASGTAPYDATNSDDYTIRKGIVELPYDLSAVPEAWQGFLAPYLEKDPEKRPALRPFEEVRATVSVPPTPSVSVQEVHEEKTLVAEKRETPRMPKPEYVTPTPKPYEEEKKTNDDKWDSTSKDNPVEEEKETKEKKFKWFGPLAVIVLVFEVLYALMLFRFGASPIYALSNGLKIILPFVIVLGLFIWLFQTQSKKFKSLPWVVIGVAVFSFVLYYLRYLF